MLCFLKWFTTPSFSEQHGEIKITISELSAVWLKYNHGFIQTSDNIELAQETSTVEEKPRKARSSSTKKVEETQPVEKTQPGEAVPGKERKFFSQEMLSEFFEPYKSIFETQGAVDGFLAILELLDHHGSCPSVVTTMTGKDSESDEIYSVRQILEKVTLREHSSNVARIMLKLIKKTYKDYENLIPMSLVVSFGHDLGKIAALRESGLYARADHPLVGAQKLAEIFSQKEPSWLRTAVDSIRDHHKSSKNSFALLLKQADSMARETEIGLYSQDLKTMEWSQWFDVKQFLEILKIDINVIQTGNRWKAFSFGSQVYCQPDFLYESARKFASEKKIIDMKLLRSSSKEEAIKRVVESLRQAKALSDDIGESYWGRPYEIQSERFKKKMFLVPLKIEAFGIPHEIERRKEGYLEIIRSVVPVKK